MNGNKMKYAELFTPIEAFAAFIIKNIEIIADKCSIGDVEDFSKSFIRHQKSEELCLMTLVHEKFNSCFICQLFNNDPFGFPESSIKEAVKIIKQKPETKVYILCPGIYPQVINEFASNKTPLNFIVVDGNICNFFPFNDIQ